MASNTNNNTGPDTEQDVNPHRLMKSWISKAEKIYSPLIQYFKNLRPDTYLKFVYDPYMGVAVTFKATAGEVYDPVECYSETLRTSNEYVPTGFYLGETIVRIHYKLKSMVK